MGGQFRGVRKDAFAKAHLLVVEEEKDAKLKGFSSAPNAFCVYGAAVATSGSASGVYGSGSTGGKGLATVANGGPGGSFTGFSGQPNSLRGGTPGIIATGGSGDPSNTQWGPNGADGLDATGGDGWVGGVGVVGHGGNVSADSVFPAQDGVLGLGGTGGGNRGGIGVEGVGGANSNDDGPGGSFAGANTSRYGDGLRAWAGSATLEILMETSTSPVLSLPQ